MNPTAPFALIACRVVIGPGVAGFLPPDNYIGGVLLFHVLQSALAVPNQQLDNATTDAGPLNRCNFVFQVSSLASALKALESALETTLLRSYATLLYYDADEMIWRVHGPNHANVQCDFSLEQIKADALATLEHVRNIRAASNPSAPQQP